MRSRHQVCRRAELALALALLLTAPAGLPAAAPAFAFNDSHFHLTNYIQQGPSLGQFLKLMDADRVGRTAVFGIPLQQQWSYRNDGDRAPTYYLASDSPLYYYSFTDAVIATEYLELPPAARARFDPMITGFNPSDMYAVDHIRRVLRTFPGVFTGIGEFSIHKEFVSSKVAGEVASLTDPALDRILDLCAQSGLLVILHNDMDTPFAKPGAEPAYLNQMRALLLRHPNTTVIWAHTGMGRVVRPVEGHAAILAAMLGDPRFHNLYFDISWSEVAKYLVASPGTLQIAANLINRYPTRFLFGTDEVAPNTAAQYESVYQLYAPLWRALTPEASRDVRLDNYLRLFNRARTQVRAWEKANLTTPPPEAPAPHQDLLPHPSSPPGGGY